MEQKGSRPTLSLWVVAFALCSALQVFRGSVGDEIIFFTGTTVLVLSTTLLRNNEFPSRFIVTERHVEWSGLVLMIALAFTARHSLFDLGIFVLLAPIVIALAWGSKPKPKPMLTKRDRTTRFVWSAWAIAMCLWEFGANILGQLFGGDKAFPTISVLVDPLLDQQVGQAGFVVVWLALGFYLLKSGAK
ncbi:MAG: hypothetical protein RJA35_536 [Actinomycetota bacterium]|jgi:hypothetical protein